MSLPPSLSVLCCVGLVTQGFLLGAENQVFSSVSASAVVQADGDADDGGTVGIDRARIDADCSAAIGGRWRLGLRLTGERSRYEFDEPATTVGVARSPLEDGRRILAVGSIGYALDPRWSVLAGAMIQSAAEVETGLEDSSTFGGLAGMRLQVNEYVAVTCGAWVLTVLEADRLWLPLLGVEWTIAERWRLHALGDEATLTWTLNTAWRLFAHARYEFRDYRLDEDSVVAGGVLRDRALPIRVGATWCATPMTSVTATAGVIAYQELRVADANGDDLTTTDLEPVPTASLTIALSF